jgi:drug/metabolite transporter (DMT)-like permease
MIFDEKLTIYLAIGGLVTLLGVFLVNKAYKITSTEQPETEECKPNPCPPKGET